MTKTIELKLTLPHVVDYCIEYESRLIDGIPDDEIIHHIRTAGHHMTEASVHEAVDELTRLGVLNQRTDGDSRMILNGDNWNQRNSILREHGWR